MKKVRMFLFLAAGLLALSACNEFPMKAPTGELSVVIVDDDVIATKASDTSERSYERKINDLQIFVFDDGTLFRYEHLLALTYGTFPLFPQLILYQHYISLILLGRLLVRLYIRFFPFWLH